MSLSMNIIQRGRVKINKARTVQVFVFCGLYIHSLSWLVMATGGSSPAWSTHNGKHTYGATGKREVLLITSNPTTQDDDVVPRRPGGELTDDDRRRLENQGIPRDCHHDDLSIAKARFSLDKDMSIAEVLRDDGSPLTCKQVTKKITQLLNNTDTCGGEVIIHYYCIQNVFCSHTLLCWPWQEGNGRLVLQ